MHKPKVFFVCPGLGHITRGFETFTQESFDALKNCQKLDIRLFKGAGPVRDTRERVLFTLRRTSWSAHVLGKLLGKSDDGAEAISFAVSLLPHLLIEKPDVVFFSDWFVGQVLRIWRSIFGLRYRLLLSNGGPFDPRRFCWDHIQQVSPQYFEEAVQAGVPEDRQTLLPYGVQIDSEFQPIQERARRELRRTLNLPTDREIVLCVSAINSRHKRIDYLIEEISRIPTPRPFLTILGQREADSAAIEDLANKLLGADGFTIRSVPKTDVRFYYQASDVFVLASLREGFGLVFVEALSCGLPCFAHDHPTARYVLGPHANLGDFSRPGGLRALLEDRSKWTSNTELAEARHRFARDTFSWGALANSYVRMLNRVGASSEIPEEECNVLAKPC